MFVREYKVYHNKNIVGGEKKLSFPVSRSQRDSAEGTTLTFMYFVDNMIQCDLCEQWLHMKCEKLNSSPEADEWLCRDCRPPEFKRVKVIV